MESFLGCTHRDGLDGERASDDLCMCVCFLLIIDVVKKLQLFDYLNFCSMFFPADRIYFLKIIREWRRDQKLLDTLCYLNASTKVCRLKDSFFLFSFDCDFVDWLSKLGEAVSVLFSLFNLSVDVRLYSMIGRVLISYPFFFM